MSRQFAVRWMAALGVAAVAAGCAAATTSGTRHPPDTRSAQWAAGRSRVANLAIPSGARPTAIPRSFLGLSTEYWTLPIDERHVALYERVISLLHVPGDGPFVLRIGGDSSDHALYDPDMRWFPRWLFDLTPRLVTRTASIVRKLHLRVILDLNLDTAPPQAAAAWVVEAEKAFPPRSIIGYEVGNEPDLSSHAWWRLVLAPDKYERTLPSEFTPAHYAAAYRTYARMLRRIDPKAPLLGPAVSNPNTGLPWIRTLLSGPHPGLRVLTAHLYPYSGCTFRWSLRYPTIRRILGEQASAGMAQSVRPMVALARRAGLAARLTEFNSVTCGGLKGVSNTFATALWAPDAIFELIRSGLSGANLHARMDTVNGPFTFDARGLVARPLLYGLILFTRTLGPDAHLVPADLHSRPSRHLKAWVVEISGHELHVLLIDKGPRSVQVSLKLPATGPATLQRLLAPSVSARWGVTLAGQTLNRDGRWSGRLRTDLIAPHAHRYSVTVPPYSAALLSVPAVAGALRD